MKWNIAVSRVRLAACNDLLDGVSDPVAAIRRERLPRMSKWHFAQLCDEYRDAQDSRQVVRA